MAENVTTLANLHHFGESDSDGNATEAGADDVLLYAVDGTMGGNDALRDNYVTATELGELMGTAAVSAGIADSTAAVNAVVRGDDTTEGQTTLVLDDGTAVACASLDSTAYVHAGTYVDAGSYVKAAGNIYTSSGDIYTSSGDIVAKSGDVTASGAVTAASVTAASVSGASVTASGEVSGATVSSTGDTSVGGALTVGGKLTTSGAATLAALTVKGTTALNGSASATNVIASGTVTAATLKATTANVTTASATTVNATTVNATDVAASGVVEAAFCTSGFRGVVASLDSEGDSTAPSMATQLSAWTAAGDYDELPNFFVTCQYSSYTNSCFSLNAYTAANASGVTKTYPVGAMVFVANQTGAERKVYAYATGESTSVSAMAKTLAAGEVGIFIYMGLNSSSKPVWYRLG